MNSAFKDLRSHEQPGACITGPQSRFRLLALVFYPNPILRTVCEPVDTFDSTLGDVADEMLALMQHHGGIGLAAPQVGLRQRLIVAGIGNQTLALVNPEVTDASKPCDSIEGCLSLPGLQTNVRRPERIRVIGFDLHGQRRSFGATGLWARVIQHELDHLNGVLILDYDHPAVESQPLGPQELEARLDRHGSQ